MNCCNVTCNSGTLAPKKKNVARLNLCWSCRIQSCCLISWALRRRPIRNCSMSSPGSPRLDIQVRERRAERCIAVVASVLALLLPWLMAAAPGTGLAPLAAGLLAAAVVAAGFYRACWWSGPQRLERVILDAEGHWLLFDASGRVREARLASDTRFGPGWVWLRWQASVPHSLLLLPCDAPPDQLRRLSMRLRIDRHSTDAVPPAAAI